MQSHGARRQPANAGRSTAAVFDEQGRERPGVRDGFFRITPQLVQACREVSEIAGRDLMQDGRWLV